MQPFGGWIGLAGMRYRASYGGQFVNLFLQQPFSALMIPLTEMWIFVTERGLMCQTWSALGNLTQYDGWS